MKKRLLTAAISTVCVLGIAATAFAVPVEFISQNWFAWGRLYDTNGVPTNLNPFDGTSSVTLPPDGTYVPTTVANYTEDSFGITEITQIRNASTLVPIWQPTAANPELTVFFRNGSDVSLTYFNTTPPLAELLTNGFVAEFYLDTKDNFDPTLGANGRTGPGVYTTASGPGEGTMVLALAGHEQYLDFLGGTTNQPYTLDGIGNPTTGAFTGSVLLDVVGGIWAQYFDTNTVDGGLSATMADLVLSYSTLQSKVTGWNIQGNATMQGDLVPEPATMLLLGTGLVGVAGAARRKKKSQA